MPPAARITDPVVHPLPPFLTPGPGSPTVLIGFLMAWRGIPAAAAAAIQAAKQAADIAVQASVAATAAAAGTPGAPVAYAAEQTLKGTVAASLGSMITGMAAGADIHMCTTPSPVPPHGPGVVVDGSPTVLINNLPACRQGDTIIEPLGPPNKIAMGCPTVMIGIMGPVGVSVVPDGFVGPLAPNQMTQSQYDSATKTLEDIARGNSQIKIEGTPEYKGQALAALARLMSRPTGRGLVEDLHKAPHTTTIKDSGGPNVGNSENADNFNNGLYDHANNRPGPGSPNTVSWNPTRVKTDGEAWETRDPAIGLGHELIHSHTDVHGTSDGRNLNYTGKDGNVHNSPGYEQQAVGLGQYEGNDYTENKIRQEHDAGVSTLGRQEPQRPFY